MDEFGISVDLAVPSLNLAIEVDGPTCGGADANLPSRATAATRVAVRAHATRATRGPIACSVGTRAIPALARASAPASSVDRCV